MKTLRNFTKGIMKENPVLVLVLGTCPSGYNRADFFQHLDFCLAEGHS